MLRTLQSPRIIHWCSVLTVGVLWEWLARSGTIPAFLLPAPTHVIARILEELQTPILWGHIGVTVRVAVTGLFIAVTLGMLCAWLFFHSRVIDAAFNWLITASQSLPVVAIAPLILLWIPQPFWARTSVATIITIYPVFAATYTALRVVPQELREMAMLNGANTWQMLRDVELPIAMPVILSGVQTSVVLALTGAVVGEYLGGRDGLGALINLARGLFDTSLVFVALCILVVLTVMAHAGIRMLQHYVAQKFE